jgi:hypothetical protein
MTSKKIVISYSRISRSEVIDRAIEKLKSLKQEKVYSEGNYSNKEYSIIIEIIDEEENTEDNSYGF